MRFTDDWREDAVLDDGTRVRLRLVRPDDKPLLVAGFERFSPESRYRRFFAPKSALTEAELRYLTEVDGTDHFALCATVEESGELRGAGVARFIRMKDPPDAAEAAVAVADDLQGRGLGRLLLQRLAAAARERGVTRFRSDVLARNETARALLRELAPELSVSAVEGEVVTLEIPLPEIPPDEPPAKQRSPLFRLLSFFARLPSPFDKT
jgi:GNAT superfamily N-acetyltransferase